MLPLGSKAIDFTLFDTTTGVEKNLAELQSDKATVIAFICNHCPFVVHIEDKFLEIAHNYQQKGVSFIAISANNIDTHPEDHPDLMAEHAKEKGYTFPYLYDATQDTAKAYKAACTPEFYIFDKEMKCVYHGRFDASSPGNPIPVSGEDLTMALDDVLLGNKVSKPQQPSMGCNIKWRVPGTKQ